MSLLGFFGNLADGLLGGASSLIGNIISNDTNMRIARENMQWQQQENERAFQRDLQMWDMQNQYNSPAAQRERIEAAGGNAMLAFGNGTQLSTGNSTERPSLKPAEAIMPNITPFQGFNLGLHRIDELLRRDKEIQLQKEATEAGVAKTKAETLNILQDTEQNKSLFPYILDAKRELINQLRVGNRLSEQQYTYNEEMNKLQIAAAKLDIDTKSFDLKYKEDVKAYRVAAEQLAAAEKRAGIYLSKAQQHMLIQQASKLASDALKTKQDMSFEAYWDAVQRNLGPKTNTEIGALAQQFGYHIISLINSIINGTLF